MARVTVEDCVDKVPNRFELVMLAAHRAREISSGAPITVGAPGGIAGRQPAGPVGFRTSRGAGCQVCRGSAVAGTAPYRTAAPVLLIFS